MYYEDERYDAMGAWHEAAHVAAIVALGHGAAIDGVTVSRDDGGPCFVSMRFDSVSPAHRGIIAVAGNIATAMHPMHRMGMTGDPVQICLASAGSDGELLRGALRDLGENQTLALLQMGNRAYELLERHKPLCIKLSLELERRGHLSGAEVRSLCGIEKPPARSTFAPASTRAAHSPDMAQSRPATAEDLQPRLREAEQRGDARAASVFRRAIAQLQGKGNLGAIERAMSPNG